jgi:hypothetical protein
VSQPFEVLSKWAWVGVVLLDLEGNYVAWQIDRPMGQIKNEMLIYRDGRIDPLARTKVDVTGQTKRWTGAWATREQLAIAQHPPLPLESE